MTSALLQENVFLKPSHHRASGTASRAALRRLDETLFRSISRSRYLKAESVFSEHEKSIRNLLKLREGWNSYASPAPTESAVSGARSILSDLRMRFLFPNRVSASAEGGIAISFVSQSPNRAIIESLNNGERYALLYNLAGDANTFDWPAEGSRDNLISMLRSHINNDVLTATKR